MSEDILATAEQVVVADKPKGKALRNFAIITVLLIAVATYLNVSIVAVRAAGAEKTFVMQRSNKDLNFIDSTLAMCDRVARDTAPGTLTAPLFGVVNGEDRFCMLNMAGTLVGAEEKIIARLPYVKLIESISLWW